MLLKDVVHSVTHNPIYIGTKALCPKIIFINHCNKIMYYIMQCQIVCEGSINEIVLHALVGVMS